jgi:Kef-type K+ transport system membrane component KefB/nucleotide-binding universal stress UspA family protein
VTRRPTEESHPRARLAGAYTVLVVLLGIVSIVVIAAGQKRNPQHEVAGGYSVRAGRACLGESMQLLQSGRFVRIRNAQDTLGGELELDDGRLTGDVDCVGGPAARLDARTGDGRVRGTIGNQRVSAELTRSASDLGVGGGRLPSSVAGTYRLSPRSECIGGELEVKGSGSRVDLEVDERTVGRARYADGNLVGTVRCPGGGQRTFTASAIDRNLTVLLLPANTRLPRAGPPPQGSERLSGEKQREAGSVFAAFFIAVAVVIVLARLLGIAAVALGQPRVIGEVVAGVALGPSLLGAISPAAQDALFPQDIVPYLEVAAQLGLIFYMFLIGLELDPRQIGRRAGQIALISNASVALPMALGIAVALPTYTLLAPDTDFLPFALFLGISMSITAFPVLARILVEKRMLKRPIGAVVLSAAAIDDVTAWILIAFGTAVAVSGSAVGVATTIVLGAAFCLVMALGVRPLLARASTAYDEAGRIPSGWTALIFAGVLISAYLTEEIGIALIFGAFVMGLIMPRHAGLTEDVTRRVEDFVVILLLPLFFVVVGLRTDIGLLDRPELWLITVVLLAIALLGKLVGAALAARVAGFEGRAPIVIGTLMNTRGLTELIVLNLALEKGVISNDLFAMLVIMALVTTLMTAPFLRLLDPHNELGAPLEEELEEARAMSLAEFPALPLFEQSVLVAPDGDAALTQLLSLAGPLARSEPPRELIIARLVRPPRGAAVRGGLQTENRLLAEATEEVNAARRELTEAGTAARAVAFISPDPGADLTRLASSEEVALTLVNGRRPLLGEGVPRGAVGTVLREAPCDVAVLVAREREPVQPGPGAPVVVPFGGAEHDWAALELAAWTCAATGAPLELLGAAGQVEERARVSRLLGDAGLLVQQYAGVSATPLVAEPGRDRVIDAAGHAGLLVIGLSSRWQREGLGRVRSEIAKAAPAPVLFVRRGIRPGALAPREDVTRFTWSAPALTQ